MNKYTKPLIRWPFCCVGWHKLGDIKEVKLNVIGSNTGKFKHRTCKVCSEVVAA